MDNNFRIGLYEKAVPNELTTLERLQVAKECNYDWVEYSIDATDAKINRIYMSKQERLELLNLTKEVGIGFDTMNISALTKYALGSSDKQTEEKGLEIAKKAIELAHDLGTRIVMIPGYDVYFEESTKETHERYLKNLKEIVAYATYYSVPLGLETMENNYMNTAKKAMNFVKEVNSHYLNVYPDTGNITNALLDTNDSMYDDIKAGEGHTVAVHLKETKPGIYREVPYGLGHTRYDEAIKASYEIGVKMFLAEFWYVGQEDWKNDCKKANEFLRSKITKYYKENDK